MNLSLRPVAACACALIVAATAAAGDNTQPAPPNPAGSGGDLATSGLTDAERKRLRVAVNEVWASDGVRQAREELQRATRAFRASLKAAINDQEDAELRRIMNRLLAERYAEETRSGKVAVARPDANGAQRSPRRPASPTSADRSAKRESPLDENDQILLQRVREDAMRDPEVIEALKERERAVDHRSRMVAAGSFRKAMRAAMLRVDPDIAKVFAKLENASGR